MFASIEEKLIVGALAAVSLLVGILGYNHHERTEGAAICVQQQSHAAATETIKDASDVKDVLKDFSGDLSAIPIAASHTPSMLMCDAPSVVHKVASSAGAKPAQLPNSGNDRSVQTGVKPEVDIGPIVQDITLGCVLTATDAQQLWNLMSKESAP